MGKISLDGLTAAVLGYILFLAAEAQIGVLALLPCNEVVGVEKEEEEEEEEEEDDEHEHRPRKKARKKEKFHPPLYKMFSEVSNAFLLAIKEAEKIHSPHTLEKSWYDVVPSLKDTSFTDNITIDPTIKSTLLSFYESMHQHARAQFNKAWENAWENALRVSSFYDSARDAILEEVDLEKELTVERQHLITPRVSYNMLYIHMWNKWACWMLRTAHAPTEQTTWIKLLKCLLKELQKTWQTRVPLDLYVSLIDRAFVGALWFDTVTYFFNSLNACFERELRTCTPENYDMLAQLIELCRIFYETLFIYGNKPYYGRFMGFSINISCADMPPEKTDVFKHELNQLGVRLKDCKKKLADFEANFDAPLDAWEESVAPLHSSVMLATNAETRVEAFLKALTAEHKDDDDDDLLAPYLM